VTNADISPDAAPLPAARLAPLEDRGRSRTLDQRRRRVLQ
jgi:hypothetical protein